MTVFLATETVTWYNDSARIALERGGDLCPHAHSAKVAAMPLDVRLLGQFAISSDGAPVAAIKSQRLQCLLAYLLLHRDAPIARQQLAFLFWPDSSEAQARSNLRNLIHALIQALPDGEQFIETDNQTVQWRAGAACTVDVDALLEMLTHVRTGQDLQHALDLYQGPLLPCCYDDWITPERERLDQQLADALQRFIDEAEKQGNYHEAITFAQKLARRDPLREDIYRQIMRLYALSGNRAGVARTFKECGEVLKRELDVEPSRQTQEAYNKYLRMEPVARTPAPDPPSRADTSPETIPVLAPPVAGDPHAIPVVPSSTPDRPLTERLIRDAVLTDWIQHPTTAIPFGLAALSAFYLLLYHPVLAPLFPLAVGGIAEKVAIGLLATSSVTGVAALVLRYVAGFERAYTDKARDLAERQQRSQREREAADLAQLRVRLAAGFDETQLAEGQAVLRDLEYEFKELHLLMARHKETDSLTLSSLPALVVETYHQGLNVLEDALELARATSSPHDRRLAAEVEDLQRRLRDACSKKAQEERIKLLQEKLDEGRQRLDLIGRERLRLEGLLQQANRCETVLHETRIQIAALKAETWTVSVNAVLATLQKTIQQAKAVQEEMRKLGY